MDMSEHTVVQGIKWLAFAVMTLTALACFGKVVRSRVAYIKLGRGALRKPPPHDDDGYPEGDEEDLAGISARTSSVATAAEAATRFERIAGWTLQVFGHRKLLQDLRSGIMHVVLFYGFIVLQFGAADIVWKGLAGSSLPYPAYRGFVLTQEITVALVLLAILYGTFRRYVERLRRLKRGWKPSIVLWFIGGLMVTVLLTQAFDRVKEASPTFSAAQTSLYTGYAPVSSPLAEALRGAGVTHAVASVLYEVFWWLHLATLLGFLVYVPQSKHFHIFTAPLNIWLRRRSSPGKLEPLDLEDEQAETFGVGAVEQFTSKQLLDLYACVECGRCTNVCPASSTGKLLSPMHLIVKLRDHLTEKAAAITSASPWVPAFGGAKEPRAHVMASVLPLWTQAGAAAETSIEATMDAQKRAWHTSGDLSPRDVNLIGDVMTESELWACTTCRNCEDQCPVANEHVDKIIDMRRYLVLTEGRVPSEAQRAMLNIERQGNPWGLPRTERAAWIAAYEAAVPGAPQVTTMRDAAGRGERPELLLWAGTMGAYDQRSRKVLFAVVRLLQQAGMPFAVLGGEEKNSGDTARRLGNELLFQTLCADNVAILQRYGVKRIVTICPHTFNALKNEYGDFGLDRAVRIEHHTTLLARLVGEGMLVPANALRERVVYHDSCYLGRYNGVYDAPRDLLRAIPGLELLEMERNRANGMCCGAGGGLMWMEERSGVRVNEARAAQAIATSPTVIGSACPYCLTMMEDGIKQQAADSGILARDVAELLAESVFGDS